MVKIDESKIIYPFFLFLCITTSIIPIILAYDLIRLDSYDAFIALLDKFYIPMSYFSKVIIKNLDYINFNVFKMIGTLLTSISYLNAIIIILCAYLWSASKETYMKKRNKCWITIILIYVVSYALIACIFIFGFQLTSLNAIISLFYYAGIIMMLTHLAIIFISVFNLIKEMMNIYKIYVDNQMIKHDSKVIE